MRKRMVKGAIMLAMLLCLACVAAFPSMTAWAVTSQTESSQTLLDAAIGRYKLNYTGGTNYYAGYGESYSGSGIYIPSGPGNYNSLSGYTNSSTGTLKQSSGASGIKYAFLVWETRADSGSSTAITFIAPDNKKYSISPTYAFNDDRIGIKSLFCMAADVTSIVKSAGYGSYSACNIPIWKDGGTADLGGESPASWQLIVVEEGDEWPVRVVTLCAGSQFRTGFVDAGANYDVTVKLANGLISKQSGNVTGQVLFGMSNASNSLPVYEDTYTYDSGGTLIRHASGSTTTSSGLFYNGVDIRGTNVDKSNGGCIRMSLTDINDNMGNSAASVKFLAQQDSWSTFFLIGLSMDVAYPDFAAEQTTTIDSLTSATVSGTITNTSAYDDTGVYNGKYVVTLDSNLSTTASGVTVWVNGQKAGASVSVSGNTVTISGSTVSSLMNGDTISYSIACGITNMKATFICSDVFAGYLCTNGLKTDIWFDRAWGASSSASGKYQLTINAGTGIADVTGGGIYAYGQSVSIYASLKTGYHWLKWTGSQEIASQSYTFAMPAGNLSLTANGEANSYTIYFDANGGDGSVDPIVTKYDEDVQLPYGEDVLYKSNGYGDSVFMGWGLYEDKEGWQPRYLSGGVVRNLVVEDGSSITLYAIWDDCPWIQAGNLYYTLDQAREGYITEDELFSHATADDREDGSPIYPGYDEEKGTLFVVEDYKESDFTQFEHEGSVTETYMVRDHVGSIYRKQVTVTIVDTTAEDASDQVSTRFVSEKYYGESDECGGFAENSVWLADAEYAKLLTDAFAGLRGERDPIATYRISHDEVILMKAWEEEYEVGSLESVDVLRQFYEEFLEGDMVE